MARKKKVRDVGKWFKKAVAVERKKKTFGEFFRKLGKGAAKTVYNGKRGKRVRGVDYI